MKTTQPTDFSPTKQLPHAVQVMKRYGLTRRSISMSLGIGTTSTYHAFDLEQCGSVSYATVIRIRHRTERMLRAAGWQGRASELWSEYDQQVLQNAA